MPQHGISYLYALELSVISLFQDKEISLEYYYRLNLLDQISFLNTYLLYRATQFCIGDKMGVANEK